MKVFLSYASEDKNVVKEFYDFFAEMGFDPWMDTEKLLPGVNWEKEITSALNTANVVVIFISKHSVRKRSFVTREANEAVANLRYKKADDIYIIPVLLDQSEVPSEISGRAQFINISAPAAKHKIATSIAHAATQQGITIKNQVNEGPYQIFIHSFEEEKIGQPGHVISLRYPEFRSVEHTEIANQISKFFDSRASNIILNHRPKPWEQSTELQVENLNEFDLFYSDGYWETFNVISATQELISLHYAVSFYGCGAAHTNEHDETFNFAISDKKIFPVTISDLFQDLNSAVEIISIKVRESLKRQFWEKFKFELDEDPYWREIFEENTSPALENFYTFAIKKDSLIFYFPPYRIAAYAYGSFSAEVAFFDLRNVLKKGDESPIKSLL